MQPSLLKFQVPGSPVSLHLCITMLITSESILLNLFKHHAGALKHFLETEPDTATVLKALKRIGHSQMDFYYGSLSPETIFKEAVFFLGQEKIDTPAAFLAWLKPEQFKSFTCSDGSVWIFREGQGQQFIHLHPGRYSPHSVRIKAATLKAAGILFRHIQSGKLVWPASRSAINHLRASELGLSPIGKNNPSDQLERTVALLLQ